MDVVICDISAWEYWRTPPLLQDVEISVERFRRMVPQNSPLRHTVPYPRPNARRADRLICSRILTDLKGLSIPVHVMVSEPRSLHASSLVHPHAMPSDLPREHLIPLGNGLSVLSPELCLVLHRKRRDAMQIAKMMFEACGIFTICPGSERLAAAMRDLVSSGALHRGCISSDQRIYEFCGPTGIPIGTTGRDGEVLPWEPGFDRRGQITDLWKRPPLTSTDRIARLLDELDGPHRFKAARRALSATIDGAASPEEARALLMLCSDRWLGGEAWKKPLLNARVDLTLEAKALSHRSFLVADALWPETRGILEVNGEVAHADENGFLIASGRTPALESMGYGVAELNHEQMADLELFDAMLPTISRKLGLPLQKRTAAFLARRDKLHRELFQRPYEPSW